MKIILLNPAFWLKVMRISSVQIVLLLVFAGISSAADSKAQLLDKLVSVHVEDQGIGKALRQIEKQATIKFVFSPQVIKSGQKINFRSQQEKLGKLLDKMLVPLGIRYEVSGKYILLSDDTGKPPAQQENSPRAVLADPDRVIRGKITGESGEALPGVSVVLKDRQKGTVSAVDGSFELTVAEGGNVILVFSFVGYLSREIEIGARGIVDVALKVDEKSLKEVVVVGYGVQSRETLTTSITKLDKKVLENIPYANAATALQGTVSGVRVQNTSGQPGMAPRVIVRGGTSINNPNGANPMYIVDGVIRPDMNNINARDIESIQVLKDAASTSVYGARGSNGVVIITTKSGKSGKTTINYNYDLSTSKVSKTYDLLSARDFIYFQRQGIYATATRKNPSQLPNLGIASAGGTGNDLTNLTQYTTQYLTPENQYKLNEGWESMQDPIDPSKTIIFQETDFNALTYRTGISHNHNISVSGGTEKATFNGGIGYLNNNGTAIRSFYKRLSVNLNGDLKVKDNLSVFGRVLYADTDFNNLGTGLFGDPFGSGGIPAPTMKHKFEDGNLAPGGIYGGIYSRQDRKNTSYNFTLVSGASWKILPGLSFEPQLSIYRTNTDSRFFQKTYQDALGNLNAGNRDANGSNAKLIQRQADAVLSYVSVFNNLHNLEAKVGFSYFGRENSSLSASGRNAASDLVPTLNASGMPVSVGGTESKQAILGYFSRINYDYQQKYLLTLNARFDGASNLGQDHKWGFFPGISAGWNLHREVFWEQLPDQLSQLKLRASYGVNGNIGNLGDYQAQGQYNVDIQYGGVAAIQNTVLANQALKWEQSQTFDVGFDLGMFNNRLSVLFDYYKRTTKNLITSLTLPHSTGFGSIMTNLGSLENKGLEIELTARLLPASNPFQWDISFNASKVKNKILKLPDNGVENNRIGGILIWDPRRNDYAWTGGLQEGGRLGDLFAYRQLGIYATDDEAAAGPLDMLVVGTNKTKYGGDVNWLDADNNGTIDARDRVYVGNIYPTWTGGFSSSLSFKNINLLVRTDYTTGHISQNETRQRLLQQTTGQNALHADLLRSWQKQGDITDIPKFYWADQQAQANYSRSNSEFFERGDFLALREITLSYSLAHKLIEKLRINGLRVNITGNNLHYFTRYKGLNPEEGGTDYGRYPIPRNIIFGVNLIL